MIELQNCSLERYNELKKSGMFWVWFPEATGTYAFDMKLADEAFLKESKEMINKTSLVWVDPVNGTSEKAKVKGDVIKIKAVEGYCSNVGTLATLNDTGDGIIVKFKSYDYFDPSKKVKLNYAEADLMYKALQVFFA